MPRGSFAMVAGACYTSAASKNAEVTDDDLADLAADRLGAEELLTLPSAVKAA